MLFGVVLVYEMFVVHRRSVVCYFSCCVVFSDMCFGVNPCVVCCYHICVVVFHVWCGVNPCVVWC